MNRPQNGDQLPLEEMLAAMERLGAAHPKFVKGYRAGFEQQDRAHAVYEGVAFLRGYRAGREARARGAHGA